ncbi:glucose N-acetyltransferase [Saccharomyces paradoxus]|uniref:Glucose N-acetyltransferase n=1 Tax=Saccharomyces paradoxus TaxID=27291 RepID=A0A8B8V089_SACPA|nr:Gnt1 [Saccharomyces paradoxus]QHS76400.1 Gnt1 [Saccharomyces paradoxus]
MRLVSKRRIRFVVFILFGVLTVFIISRCIVHFQYNEEIKYYKKYFQQRKDGLHEIYNPLEIKQIPEKTIDELYATRLDKELKNNEVIEWSKFAYVNYVTNADYLCNTLIIFNNLKQEFGTKAKLVLLISKDLLDSNTSSNVDYIKLLLDKIQAIDESQVVIKFIDNIVKPKDTTPWNESLTKLLVFNQTEFNRVIYLDNDAILRSNLDELFFLPDYIRFAAPLTYWFLSNSDLEKSYHETQHREKQPINLGSYTKVLTRRIAKGQMIYNHLPSLPHSLYLDSNNIAQDIISSTSSLSPLFDFQSSKKVGKLKFASNLMVISPSKEVFDEIVGVTLPKILNKKEKYDMDLINEEMYNLKKIIYEQFIFFRKVRKLFKPEVLVLPFARYGLLTGSLRNPQHYSMIYNDVLGYKTLDKNGDDIPAGLNGTVAYSKYIHFSDYPLAKPWNYPSMKEFECTVKEEKAKDPELEHQACDLWNSVYASYIQSREICFV